MGGELCERLLKIAGCSTPARQIGDRSAGRLPCPFRSRTAVACGEKILKNPTSLCGPAATSQPFREAEPQIDLVGEAGDRLAQGGLRILGASQQRLPPGHAEWSGRRGELFAHPRQCPLSRLAITAFQLAGEEGKPAGQAGCILNDEALKGLDGRGRSARLGEQLPKPEHVIRGEWLVGRDDPFRQCGGCIGPPCAKLHLGGQPRKPRRHLRSKSFESLAGLVMATCLREEHDYVSGEGGVVGAQLQALLQPLDGSRTVATQQLQIGPQPLNHGPVGPLLLRPCQQILRCGELGRIILWCLGCSRCLCSIRWGGRVSAEGNRQQQLGGFGGAGLGAVWPADAGDLGRRARRLRQIALVARQFEEDRVSRKIIRLGRQQQFQRVFGSGLVAAGKPTGGDRRQQPRRILWR